MWHHNFIQPDISGFYSPDIGNNDITVKDRKSNEAI